MNVVVDNGGYDMQNLGDLATLQTAITRIVEYDPDATVVVLTGAAADLGRFVPRATALSVQSRESWYRAPALPVVRKLLPASLAERSWDTESWFKLHFPRAAALLMRTRAALRQVEIAGAMQYFSAIRDADIVVATGGGYIADSFRRHAGLVLDTMKLAQSLGKPTAMFGQGIGPLRDKSLRMKAGQVFPRLRALGLRDSLTSLKIAKSLRVPQERLYITGDDAIELALERDGPTPARDCIGVNVRRARYAGNVEERFPAIGRLLKEMAGTHHAQLVALPIDLNGKNGDLASIEQLCDLDISERRLALDIKSPEDVIRQIGRCKAVIAGSYHAAVFALAQGIPVVGLVGSEYYAEKFYGLAGLFEAGCTVQLLDSPKLIDELRSALQYRLERQKGRQEALSNQAMMLSQRSREAWRSFFSLL
jgi:polysaccharide pyruvyl transferase WcaK-like protein